MRNIGIEETIAATQKVIDKDVIGNSWTEDEKLCEEKVIVMVGRNGVM